MRLTTGLVLLVTTLLSCGETEAPPTLSRPSDVGAAGYVWEPFAFATKVPDPKTDRICKGWEDPEGLADKIYIDCELEGFDFTGGVVAAPKDALRVMVWNLERGLRLNEQLAWATSEPPFDVLLLSELDRGCSRSGHKNVTAEWAKALKMHSVFAVEYVELPRLGADSVRIEETCEHGNAILSRYPLGNVKQIRHRTAKSWYQPPEKRLDGEPRLGGNVAIAADVQIGDQIVHFVSLHFESDPVRAYINTDQATELIEFAADKPFQVVLGGDTNAPYYFVDLMSSQEQPLDQTTQTFFAAGYVDSHASLEYRDRPTHDPGLVIDIMFGNGAFFRDPIVCHDAPCGQLSDHFPLWATMDLR